MTVTVLKQEIRDYSATPDGVPAHKMITLPIHSLPTVKDVRQAKSELEELLAAVLRNFERRSGCPVTNVQIRVIQSSYKVTVDVKI